MDTFKCTVCYSNKFAEFLYYCFINVLIFSLSGLLLTYMHIHFFLVLSFLLLFLKKTLYLHDWFLILPSIFL